MAKDVAALKAVSQNLMHENLAITDGVYGVLSTGNVKRQIAGLVQSAGLPKDGGLDELVAVTRQLLAKLEDKVERD